MADELRLPEGNNPNPAAPQVPIQFPTDSSALSTIYTNFCRFSGTPEEVILDFGLNTQIVPNPTEPIKLTHRVVMNYYTAKRLLGTMMKVLQQHENTFGVLEIDFQKRMKGGWSVPPSAPKG